jgi:hypothetical protein
VQNTPLHQKQKQGVENSQWPKKNCTRQFALNADRNAKFPSNLTQTDPFTAENAGQKNAHHEDDTKPANTKLSNTVSSIIFLFYLIVFCLVLVLDVFLYSCCCDVFRVHNNFSGFVWVVGFLVLACSLVCWLVGKLLQLQVEASRVKP